MRWRKHCLLWCVKHVVLNYVCIHVCVCWSSNERKCILCHVWCIVVAYICTILFICNWCIDSVKHAYECGLGRIVKGGEAKNLKVKKFGKDIISHVLTPHTVFTNSKGEARFWQRGMNPPPPPLPPSLNEALNEPLNEALHVYR